MFRRCSGDVFQKVFRRCSGHFQEMFGICSGHVWEMFRTYFGHVWEMFGVFLGENMANRYWNVLHLNIKQLSFPTLSKCWRFWAKMHIFAFFNAGAILKALHCTNTCHSTCLSTDNLSFWFIFSFSTSYSYKNGIIADVLAKELWLVLCKVIVQRKI